MLEGTKCFTDVTVSPVMALDMGLSLGKKKIYTHIYTHMFVYKNVEQNLLPEKTASALSTMECPTHLICPTYDYD